jgi:hypothetical protein
MPDIKNFLQDKFVVLGDEKLFEFTDIKKFIFINDNIDKVIGINRTYGSKINQINFTGSLKEALRIEQQGKQIIKIFPDSEREIIRQAKSLKTKNFIFCPEYPIKKVEHVSLLSSMGFVVDLISVIDCLDTSLTLEILDYYLHSRSLSVPIEPFHTILLSKIQQVKTTLWNMNLMNPNQFIHSDGVGLSESPGDLAIKEYQFLIDYQGQTLSRTNRKSSLENFYKSLPQNHPDCMACPHFHLCFSWAVYKKNSCEKWKKILARLQEASREIQALEKFDREHAAQKDYPIT